MTIDLKSNEMIELSQAVDDSFAVDQPAAWRPAFAAADDKGTKQALSTQLKEQTGNATTAMSRVADLRPNASSGFNLAMSQGFGGFLSFLNGWLSRA